MRQGLSFAYGALTEHLNDEQRADVDAILDGTTPPSQIPAPASPQADWHEHVLVADGEIG